jgi:hypothetical protein
MTLTVSTIVTTAGSASANAYCTLDFAKQYQMDRPVTSSAWDDATDADKSAAILWATKLLDAQWDWNGAVVTPTVQALLFPRSGLLHRNRLSVVLPTEIPIELQQANAEFARQLLEADRAADSDVETQGIRAIKAGSVALQFKDNVVAKVVPDAVVALIPPEWGRVRSRGGAQSVELLRA